MSDDIKNDYERALTLVSPQKDNLTNAADVDRLRTLFLGSTVTLEDFCALYASDVPGVNLKALATRQKWISVRKEARQAMSQEARERMKQQGIEFETKIDGTVHRASKKLVRLIGEILTNVTDAAEKARSTNGHSLLTLDDLPKIGAGVKALNDAYALARKTAGLTAEPMPGRDQINLGNLSHDERETMKSLLLKAAGPKRSVG